MELLWDLDVVGHQADIQEHLATLIRVDGMRTAFYNHLQAQSALHHRAMLSPTLTPSAHRLALELVYRRNPLATDDGSALSGLDLAAMPTNLHLLANRRRVDLSSNHLTTLRGYVRGQKSLLAYMHGWAMFLACPNSWSARSLLLTATGSLNWHPRLYLVSQLFSGMPFQDGLHVHSRVGAVSCCCP